MTDTKSRQPIEKLNLDILADILSRVDRLPELAPIIRSHRLFYNAFKEHETTITNNIILRRMPLEVLPYSLALRDTVSWDYAGTGNEAKGLMDRLKLATLNLRKCVSTLSQLTVAQKCLVEKVYLSVESLMVDYARETIPAFNVRLQMQHRMKLSEREKIRIARAFLRYQIMVNLFCRGNMNVANGRDFWDLQIFSPLVNEQIASVYFFLLRRASRAWEVLGAHNIQWGDAGVEWAVRLHTHPYVQNMLTRGLPFLAAISKAKSEIRDYDAYDKVLKSEVLEPHHERKFPHTILCYMMTDNYLHKFEKDSHCELPLGSLTPEQLKALSRPADGEGDGPDSSVFATWLAAYHDVKLPHITFYFSQTWFWEVGISIFDHDERRTDVLRERCNALRDTPLWFPTYAQEGMWNQDNIDVSQRQREDIFKAGGYGFWPKPGCHCGGYDFSRVKGLHEKIKALLTAKWNIEDKEEHDRIDALFLNQTNFSENDPYFLNMGLTRLGNN